MLFLKVKTALPTSGLWTSDFYYYSTVVDSEFESAKTIEKRKKKKIAWASGRDDHGLFFNGCHIFHFFLVVSYGQT